MAYNDFKRYVWLIDLLQTNEEMTFKEISNAWKDEKGLPLRTFHNHIKAIKEIFDIEIYYRDGFWQINPMSWINMSLLKRSLLSKLSLNNTIWEFDPLNDRIIYEEDAEPDNEILRKITRAMNKGLRIKLTYQRFGAESKQYWFEPYCLKMFNHRWYLLGRKKGEKKLIVLSMDERLKAVEDPADPAIEHYLYPKSFSGKDYFESSVGVIVNPGNVEPIRIKVFKDQVYYWRSAPLHHSQKEIKKANGYSIFELMLNPDSLELEQLLFSKINQIEVLEPDSLREKMISYIKKMQKLYSI
jgi:hypothetical protein